MRPFIYIALLVLFGCKQNSGAPENYPENVNTATDDSLQAEQLLLDVSIRGNRFEMDLVEQVVRYSFEGVLHRVDSLPDYELLPFDTLDLNLDGLTDVKFDYAEPGYGFEAWYIQDPDGHFYTVLPFQLAYPTIIDSLKLMLFTRELLGMDGDYNSSLLQIKGGVPIYYGRIEHRNIYDDHGDWHNEIHIFNMNNVDVTEHYFKTSSLYQGLEPNEFWMVNYLTFMK